MTKKTFFLCFLTLLCYSAIAQRKQKKKEEQIRTEKQELVYTDKNYLSSILSVQFHPVGKEADFPIIALDSDEQLQLNFDDLRGDIRNFYFSIEHCNANWESSRVSPLDYAIGFNEDRIEDIVSSRSTMQAYSNYNLIFPTAYVKPKIAGNYLLKVYEDADKARLILSRKFYVYRNLIKTNATIIPSPIVAESSSHQKINANITSAALTIDNPQRDIQLFVIQNGRNDYHLQTNDPSFVGPNEIRYDKNQTLNFKGNKEFRSVDLRSFRLASSTIKSIRSDSIISILLHTDLDQSTQNYASTIDENGKFFIRNMDLTDEPNSSADYADVTFTLKTMQLMHGKIYLVGAFNNFIPTDKYQLKWDDTSNLYKMTCKLKQGLYDYDYIFVDEKGKISTDKFSNSHFETGNTYQLLIYHRRLGTYWDELSGYLSLSTSNKQH